MTKMAQAGSVEDSQGGSVKTAQGVGVQHCLQEGWGVVEVETVRAALGHTQGGVQGGGAQGGGARGGTVQDCTVNCIVKNIV